jgi:5-methylcytosine-specific restriction endonuclease McrA
VYNENIDIINPERHPRTLCGVEGGWQLDHIIPIKECFDRGIPPREAASLTNLRMLPWKENLMRQYKNV